jgi:oligosaccharyltransferase complex subunit alpha (ribophorin I)
MDTLGRTSLELTAINVVDELRDRELIVTYDYPSSAKFRKPLTIAAAILLVFGISWVVGNLNVSIGRKQKAA